MSTVYDKCPNCGNENLAGYQDKRICNVCGWRSDKPDLMPPWPPAAPAPAAAVAAPPSKAVPSETEPGKEVEEMPEGEKQAEEQPSK